MSVHALRLVWKYDGEDVDLGTCFNTSRPAVGDLIGFSSTAADNPTGVWRVVLVYHQPFTHGSQAWCDWQRGAQPEDLTTYWVEPAEGPWEP